MVSEAISKSIFDGLQAAIPESALTISDWAEKYRVVSQERVADPSLAGSWRNDRTPYLVEIMNAVTDSSVNEIIFKKSAQVGGTEVLNNIIGFFIHIDPATILYVAENEGKARAWSTECFAPMLRDTPVLAEIMHTAKQRDSSNQIESKAFRGGHFALAWATSPATLSSRPRRVILTDETDAFISTNEGNPIDLAEARTKTAGNQRKIIHVSTPREAETSVIEPMYQNSTRERFFVPCPHCEEFQTLDFRDSETGLRNLRWDDDAPETAYYVCAACACVIEDSDKEWMLERGEWRVTNPDYRGNRRGFWISELYSPFSAWSDLAKAYLEAKNHPDKLQVFVNTRLAELWQTDGEKIDYADLSFKKEDFAAEVPDGVLLLTAGVDVQDDRLECEIVGWGEDFENWSVAYKVFYGSPAEKEVWQELKDFLTRDFDGEGDAVFRVKAAAIDTGGHHTQDVYKFCKNNTGRRFFAIKGANTPGKPISPQKPSIVGTLRVRLFTIGTEAAKDLIFAGLKKQEFGPGFCHFPSDRDEHYFKMLCAEKKIQKFVSGKAKHFWVKVSERARNEALDCRVYALAAVHILNPDWKSFRHGIKTRREKKSAQIDPRKITSAENDLIPQRQAKRQTKSFVPKRRGGFVQGWK